MLEPKLQFKIEDRGFAIIQAEIFKKAVDEADFEEGSVKYEYDEKTQILTFTGIGEIMQHEMERMVSFVFPVPLDAFHKLDMFKRELIP